MKKSLISLLVGLSVGSSFAVSAADQERWFEVEVILFERNINPAKVTEHWDQSLYPTYSKSNKNPMALFINDDNLITPNSRHGINTLALGNESNTVASGLQPTIIDDSQTLPVFGADRDEPLVQSVGINADIIEATNVVIDGANLKDRVKDPALEIVPASELQLTAQFKALNNHANYNVVLHSAWRMQPKDRNEAVPIRLFAGHNYQQQYQPNGDVITQQIEPVVTPISALDVSAELAEPTAPVWKIDGELTIYLEHYLYAKTNLFVRKEGTKTITAKESIAAESQESNQATNVENIDLLALLGIHLEPKAAEHNGVVLSNAEVTVEETNIIEPQDKTVPFLNSYPMQQLRVIRSGEIHYLDHPMFGMLIQIRKYEQPMTKDTTLKTAK